LALMAPGVPAQGGPWITWRSRFCEERLQGLEEGPRPGRPQRIPLAQVAEVKALACELPAE